MSVYWICPGCGYEAGNEEEKQAHVALLPRWFSGNNSMVMDFEEMLLLRELLRGPL